jgi:cysteinyl-tRNA synthetase
MLAQLFEAAKLINSVAAGSATINAEDKQELKKLFDDLLFEIGGINPEDKSKSQDESKLGEVMEILLNLRIEAKANKDFSTADKIRDKLIQAGFIIKDKKDGFEWELK